MPVSTKLKQVEEKSPYNIMLYPVTTRGIEFQEQRHHQARKKATVLGAGQRNAEKSRREF